MLLPLLVAACGYPTYYPDASGYSLDTGAAVPCGAAWSAAPVELDIVNHVGLDVWIYEVTADCAEAGAGTVPDGATVPVATHPGAVYVARTVDGGLRAWTQVPDGMPTSTWEVW